MVNPNYRVDLFIIESTQPALTSMQQKLNQWITTSQLVKFETTVVGDKILYTVCRVKQAE